MDMNELYRVHQVSIAQASRATSPEARIAHSDCAKEYATLIARRQRASGVVTPTVVSAS